MSDCEGLEPIGAAFQNRSWLELDGLDRVRQPAEDPSERREQLAETSGAVQRQGHLAPAQRERLQHPRQAEVVVRVKVREEDLLEIDEPHVAAQELALRALRAVEQEPLPSPAHERGAQGALGGRHGAGRPEEDDVEVHGGGF